MTINSQQFVALGRGPVYGAACMHACMHVCEESYVFVYQWSPCSVLCEALKDSSPPHQSTYIYIHRHIYVWGCLCIEYGAVYSKDDTVTPAKAKVAKSSHTSLILTILEVLKLELPGLGMNVLVAEVITIPQLVCLSATQALAG
jgi:hypothetical protein